MNTSAQRHYHSPTHLFTLRLWVEEWGHGQGEVRMQVKHVLSGETYYFRDWSAVVAYLITKVQEYEELPNATNRQDFTPV